MLAKLLGYKKLDFVSDGKPVKGTVLYYAYKEDGVEGDACERRFLQDGFKLPVLKVGAMLKIDFNNKGKIIHVELAQQ